MRNRTTWIVLLAIFSIICGYNLFMTYKQFSIDKELKTLQAKAEAERKKPLKEQDSTSIKKYEGKITNADFQADWKTAIDNSFSLGLDLQGGMFVTLEVGVEDIVRELANNSKDPVFTKALAKTIEDKKNSQSSFVDLFLKNIKAENPNVSLGAIFANPSRNISVSTPEDKIVAMLNENANSAIDRTFNIIRTRIDQFGVVSPNMQKQTNTGRILLELPGVKDPKRVRQLLKSTARLEFWKTYTIQEAYPTLTTINDKLKVVEGLVSADSLKKDSTENAVAATDSTGKKGTDSVASAKTKADSTKDAGLTDAQKAEKFKRENPLFAVLLPPDGKSITATSPIVGYSLPNDTAKVNSYLKLEDVKSSIPDDMRFVWSFKPVLGPYHAMVVLKADESGAALGGERISSARNNFDDNGRAIVEMSMDMEGAAEWKRITGENVGKSVAVVLDGMAYSYPTVQGEIAGGRSQISGDFTIDEAKDLANVLKAGQLPVAAKIQGEDVVGPTLGASNIDSGLISFAIALLITIAFMVWYYRQAGVYATIALLFNLFVLIGMTAAFGVVLTLPGIAGIVLTIGMAVDSNVLIFERIREELGLGKGLKASIREGFANALSSIMDSQITTFLTALVLFGFGVGPIKGFAVTLMIGIFTSLVSALILTRLILEGQANKGKDISFGTGFTINLFNGLDIKMSTRKRMFYMISGTLTVLSLISFATVGFKLGVDFKGGRQYVVELKGANLNDGDLEKMRGVLTKTFENDAPVIKTLSSTSQVQVTTSYKQADPNSGQLVQDKLMEGLKQTHPSNQATVLSSTDVGPVVANDIKKSAMWAVLLSLLVIGAYILFRFRKWQYSLGAVASLFHDVIIVLGLFSLFSIIPMPFNVEIDSAFIAAILTIIGYSINDTVVVFDRIRENTAEHPNQDYTTVFNDAINQTLSRTLITSGTTVLSAFVLLLFGGTVIKGFVFAIFMGIIFGTYSSIFVASAVALDFFERSKAQEAEAAKA
ncbi:MAG: protein translocase subunit SecDF [Bacteroidia bacterium]